MMRQLLLISVLGSTCSLPLSTAIVSAFVSQTPIKANRRFGSCPATDGRWKILKASKTSWSPADDWSSLSSDHPENAVPDSDTIYNKDLAAKAASAMEATSQGREGSFSEEDSWVYDTVDTIHHNGFYFEPSENDPNLYDTGFEDYTKTVNFEDEMGRQISMLVRCNESPEDLLIDEGRALPPLSKEERDNITQLLTQWEDGTFAPTTFFRDAVSTMFREHSVLDQVKDTEIPVLNAASIARWMTKSLGEDASVGPHDKRVLMTISKFGQYGTGFLTEEDFHNLYLSVAVGALDNHERPSKPSAYYSAARMKKLKLQQPTLDSIWRDIRNHGLVAPIESERARLAEEIRSKYGAADRAEAQARGEMFDSLLDECEILDFQDSFNSPSPISIDDSTNSDTTRSWKSSHELVELCSDNKTPKRVRDGEFVFIDEQSCIGCTQCAQISPSSFLMLEEGRARTFEQRNAPDVAMAVSACPVNCMHMVSFRELKEMELARDANDWEDADRRHLNHRRGNVPLNVAGMDSDANHRSSWYHYLKQKCHMSKDCPQRGCYDCPHFASPGENPFFKKLHRKAEHVRASDLSDSVWRKTAEL